MSAAPRLRKRCDNCADTESRFRSDVLRQAAEGPNFAGSFTLVMLHCGTGCLSFEVIDAKSGKVFRKTPFETLLIGPFGGPHETDQGYLQYRLDSRLLVAAGCFDTVVDVRKGYCGTVYYEWRGEHFNLVKKIVMEDRD